MPHLIVDLKSWFVNSFDVEANTYAISSSIDAKAIKNHHQIGKWFDRLKAKYGSLANSTPISVDFVDFGDKEQGMYLTVGDYAKKDQFVRFYVISINVGKKTIGVRQKALPYLFTEHFYQRIVDRSAIHDKDKLLKLVHDEYFAVYGVITLLYGFASLNKDMAYLPIPFLGGLALVYLFVVPKETPALVSAGFLVRQNGSVAKNMRIACPIHSATVNDASGNEHLIGMRFSTWIHKNDANEAQLLFGDLVERFSSEHNQFLREDMSEHLSNKLPEPKQEKWIGLVDKFNDVVHAAMSKAQIESAFFEPKSLRNVPKVVVSSFAT
ncbi:MAG: hypothetical protein K0U21_00305 [Proteobacteria bacterium]|nr:hypothetical protein [Pseudomonadota bacterium]